MRVKKIGAILAGAVMIGTPKPKGFKKEKKKGDGDRIKVYFDNCPTGINTSDIDTTPISKMRENVKIMMIVNGIEEEE